MSHKADQYTVMEQLNILYNLSDIRSKPHVTLIEQSDILEKVMGFKHIFKCNCGNKTLRSNAKNLSITTLAL